MRPVRFGRHVPLERDTRFAGEAHSSDVTRPAPDRAYVLFCYC